jgi:sugar phosphate isomerase/epimerase
VGRPGDPDAFLIEALPGELDLLELPSQLKGRGIASLELCHFHLPSDDAEYVQKLRTAMIENEIELWSLLIDDGDIAHPETGDRDREWIEGWIERAVDLGAQCVRVIGGQQPTSPEALERSVGQLRKLQEFAEARKIRLLTENWHETLSTPAALCFVLDDLRGEVGLCFDFGNWTGPGKYKELAEIVGHATSCHAKCEFVEGVPNEEDFQHCLELTKNAGFDGPYTIVHGEPGRVWESIEEQLALLRPHLES